MFSAVTNRVSRTAMAGFVVAGMGLAMLGSSGAVHAQPNDSGDGGTGGCKYASVDYKEGDKVKQDDGITYRCHEGVWVLNLVLPPTTGPKLNHLPATGVLQRAP